MIRKFLKVQWLVAVLRWGRLLPVLLMLLVTNAVLAGVGYQNWSGQQTRSAIGSPVVASFPSESFGGALADEANADPNTAIYCRLGDDPGGTSIPNCGLSAVKHQGVGPFSTVNYLTGTLPGDGTTVGHVCIVFKPTSFAAKQYLLDSAGLAIYVNQTTGTLEFLDLESQTATTANAAVLNATNLVCAGFLGSQTMAIQLNGGALADTGLQDDGLVGVTTARVGLKLDSTLPFTGYLYEAFHSTANGSQVLFDAAWTAVSTCRNAGRCLPVPSSERWYLSGDAYLVGGSWTPSAGSLLTPFALTGQVLTAKSRYNWPALAWTHNGTVPRVTQSNLYPEGFGAKHGGIGGFAATSKDLSLGSGSDVMDAANFTMGIIYEPTATANTEVLLSDGIINVPGWYVTKGTSNQVTMVFSQTGSNSSAALETAVATGSTYVAVGGAATGTAYTIGTSGAAVVTNPLNYAVDPGNNVARVGVYSNRAYPFAGTIKEVFFSTTPASAAYVTAQRNAALSCTKPGPCFTPDANTVEHCYVPTGGGKWLCPINTGADQWTENGTLTKTTPVRYVWPAGVDKRDAEGAGPYSGANYFQLGTGAGVLHFGDDFSCCDVFTATTPGTGGQTMLYNGTGGGDGYIVGIANATATFGLYDNAGTVINTTNAVPATGASIACYGGNSGTGIVKLNGGAATSGALTLSTPGTAPTILGTSFVGAQHEFYCSSAPATDAAFTRIQQRWLDHQSSTTQPVTVTRTTTATSVVDGKLYRHPAGTLRTTPSGKLYEGAVSNLAKYSEQFQQAAAGYWIDTHGGASDPGSTAVLADQGTGMDGQTTADRLTIPLAADADDYTARCEPFTGTAALYTASVWLKTASGTAAPHIYFWNGAATYYSTSCATTTTASRCQITSGANLTAAVWQFCIGHDLRDATQLAGPAATVLAWGAQVETGAFPHQYCGPSLTTTLVCNADAVTVANPLRPQGLDWTNGILQSETLGTTWTTSNITIASDVLAAPDGSFTADTIVPASDGDQRRLMGGFTATAARWTTEFWLIGIGTTSADFGIFQGAGFIASTAQILSGSGSLAAGGAANLLRVTGLSTTDWTRIAVTTDGNLAAAAAALYVYPFAYASQTTAHSMSLWGAQAHAGATVASYCPTTTAVTTCGPGGFTGKGLRSANGGGVDYTSPTGLLAAWPMDGAALPVSPAIGIRDVLGVHNLTAGTTANEAVFGTIDGAKRFGPNRGNTEADGLKAQMTGDVTIAFYTKQYEAHDYVESAVLFTQTGDGEAETENSQGTVYLTSERKPSFLWEYGAGNNSNCTSDTVLPFGATAPWVHLAVTRTDNGDGTATARIYLNGALDKTCAALNPPTGGQGTVFTQVCGSPGVALFNDYHGDMDDLRVYGRALTPTEIADLNQLDKPLPRIQRWCVRAKDVTPESDAAWSAVGRTIFDSIFSITHNRLWFNTQVNGALSLSLSDGAGVSATRTATDPLTAGTHNLIACVNDGISILYVDGAAVASTVTGTGTGLISMWQPTVTIGSNVPITHFLRGYLGSLDFCTEGSPLDCGWLE